MILLSLLAPALLGLSELPPQKLVRGRCVTFLWTRTETPVRIAMVDEMARTMRLNRGRQMVDIAQQAPNFYAGHGYMVTLTLGFTEREGLAGGTLVDGGVMRIEVPSGEAVVVPVGGMRACQ